MKNLDLRGSIAVLAVGTFASTGVASPTPPQQSARAGETAVRDELDCGFLSSEVSLTEVRAAAARGEIRDPASRPKPLLPPSAPSSPQVGADLPCLSAAHIFPYEDSSQVLVSNFSTGQLIDLMVTAANDLLANHGDEYDFIGFWVNSVPHHKIGTAFYMQIANDTAGIGLSMFDNHQSIGLAGQRIEGFVMMWNINNSFWQPGTGANADFTRLALAQEYEHRWALFLPDLLDGRVMQGDNGSCGRVAHWNWKVDGQGSGMEISEWVGSNPASLVGNFVTFNTDIAGGVFSYSDLYLMGYVSPLEMDTGNSELRYMDNSNCGNSYGGSISHFTSADIIASAGPRVPDSTADQKHFRSAWIMIHQPGDAPSQNELAKCVAILEQHQVDWDHSTLGLGTMDNTLFDDCNCNNVPDATDIATGTSADQNSNGVPDECEGLGVAFCSPAVANSTGGPAFLSATGSSVVTAADFHLSASGLPPNENGFFLASLTPAFVTHPGGSQGNLCLGADIGRFNTQVQQSGAGGSFGIDVDLANIPTNPPQPVLSGQSWHFQGWYRDDNPGPTSNFTDSVEVTFR